MGLFDLTINDPLVLGTQDPLLFVIKYYEDFTDAQTGVNEILTPNAYLISAPPLQTIFVRIEDLGGLCFALEEFTINYSQPSVGELTDENFCDVNSSGVIAVNLPELKDGEVIGALDPLLYEITYHNSFDDANTDLTHCR